MRYGAEMSRQRNRIRGSLGQNHSHKSYDHIVRWGTARRAAASPLAEEVSRDEYQATDLRQLLL